MQDEALLPVSWRSRPRSFVALMSLYESNYIRLRSLCGGQFPTSLGEYRSTVEGDLDLLLEVVEVAPYTTTLSLTYLLPAAEGGEGVERFPDVRIRLYSDARLGEAQEWASRHSHPALRALRRDAERELDQRWALNMMLNKWLDYCMERGHRFA
ncbi:MAG: DUF1249 domain-containing protein [Steroidobacteraceae bacterium]